MGRGPGAARGAASTVVRASRSPRRVDILRAMGVAHEVDPADVDETPLPGEAPAALALRLARAKAAAVAARRGPGAIVLGADTTIDLDGAILGQPRDDADARRMLHALSGRAHRVVTAVCVRRGDGALDGHDAAVVVMRPLPDELVEWYVATGEPRGKAGAYAVQGRGAALVASVRGAQSTVVGLPVALTARLLGAHGLLGLAGGEGRQ
ncbi:MAG: Maf family protein [Ilumatobacteraceae bacterium]